MQVKINFNVILISLILITSVKCDMLKVTIPDIGIYFGVESLTNLNRTYFQFRYVKYAEIPDGNLFQPPIPSPKGDFGKYYPICKHWAWDDHYNHNQTGPLKKCLAIHITTKDVNASQPVMVYIPSFDFSRNHLTDINARYLLDKDIVLITVQYRLGPLGFLSTNTEEIPGNAGILDVIESLKYIKEYIKYFGGDPNCVTLFGQYKAAGLIGILTASPLSENLFNQVIYQSGSPSMHRLTTENPLPFVKEIGNQLNCKNVDDINELNMCLIKTDISDLWGAYDELLIKKKGDIGYVTLDGPSGVISKLNTFRHYPMMGGVVDYPGVLLLDLYSNKSNSVYSVEEITDKFQKDILQNPLNQIKFDQIIHAGHYLVSLKLFAKLEGNDNFKTKIDLESFKLKLSVLDPLLVNMRLNKNRSYLYAFKYYGSEHRIAEKRNILLKHYSTILDDEKYLFGDFNKDNNEEGYLAQIMVDLWTSFAETGIPNSDKFQDKWPQIRNFKGPYLVIDIKPRVNCNYQTELASANECDDKKPDDDSCTFINHEIFAYSRDCDK